MWNSVIQFLNDNAGVLVAIGMAGAALAVGFKAAWKVLAHIYDFRKLQKEHDAVKEQYNAEKQRNEKLEREIAELKKIEVFGRWHFFPSDPTPRMPLCPVCFADQIPLRLKAFYQDVCNSQTSRETHREVGFLCDRCKHTFRLEQWEEKMVTQLLGIDIQHVKHFQDQAM